MRVVGRPFRDGVRAPRLPRPGYLFVFAFALGAGFTAGAFFAGAFFAAALGAAFAAARTGFICCSQQTISQASAQPHAVSTTTISPHVLQVSLSP
jgi:hypothetical protein